SRSTPHPSSIWRSTGCGCACRQGDTVYLTMERDQPPAVRINIIECAPLARDVEGTARANVIFATDECAARNWHAPRCVPPFYRMNSGKRTELHPHPKERSHARKAHWYSHRRRRCSGTEFGHYIGRLPRLRNRMRGDRYPPRLGR